MANFMFLIWRPSCIKAFDPFKKFKFYYGPYSPKLNVLKFMNYNESDTENKKFEQSVDYAVNANFNEITTILTGA